jgi:hypothetical protein
MRDMRTGIFSKLLSIQNKNENFFVGPFYSWTNGTITGYYPGQGCKAM